MSDVKMGAAGLIRLTTATAFVVGFLLSVFPAGSYFAVKHTEINSAINAEADINARLVGELISQDHANWRHDSLPLSSLLEKRLPDKTPEIRRIFDLSGQIVSASVDSIGYWKISARKPIYHSGQLIGELEISRSITELIGNTVGIAVVSLWFAVWSYLILRILPSRALNNALEAASASKEQAHQAMIERNKAEEAARLRSVFLANMSHELRTPMNGVLGMIDLISDTDLDAEQQEYVNLAHSSGKHLLSIINDILDFSKIDEGKLEIVPALFNLHELANQILQQFSAQLQKNGLLLESSFASDLPSIVIADPVRVRQILVNLLGNAIKFTAAGQVKIFINKEQLNDKTYIDFLVEDTGIGISEEKLDYIFDPFTQADESATRKHGGTGLGLAISRQLATSMGGSLSVVSTMGHGSVFHLRLPVKIPK
jgi:signal transduction histidine kinase